MTRPRRLLTLGHSYIVANNRRLAHEMAVAGEGEWEVTVAAPQFFHADLRSMRLEPLEGERARLEPVTALYSRYVHLMRYGSRLRELMTSEPWDVIHAWEEPFILASEQFTRWLPWRSPHLVFSTFQNIGKRYPPPFSWVEKRSLLRASGWIAFGRTVEEALKDRDGYRDRPHRLIPPGVDTAHFSPDAEARARTFAALGWTMDGPPVVGFLGRFVPEKGLATLTAALSAAKEPWRALFVGGGPEEEVLSRWAERFPGRVAVVTSVRHGEVPAHLNAMDVLCAPSRTTPRWREQFGRMLVEAMACGVPVVASRSGEIPHVVGDAGLIVAEDDVAAWTAAIDGLLSAAPRRATLAARGLERARGEFALPVVARRHLDFFGDILDGKVRGR